MSLFEPLTINQTYTAPPVSDFMNHPIGCIAFLIVMLVIFSLSSIIYQIYCYETINITMPSIPITRTEAMGVLVAGLTKHLTEETDSLIKLILCDFCGYKSSDLQHLRNGTQELAQLKQKFKSNKIHPIHQSIMFFSYGNLILFILISSLLFASYCGVVFMVQNDQFMRRYSIPFECKVDEYDTCIVHKDVMLWRHMYKYSDYTNFYNDTFQPYLQRLGDATMIKRFENNPILRISFKTQNVSAYSDQYNFDSNAYERVRTGYLYLSEKGLSDSDVVLSEELFDGCCSQDSCQECCCCGKRCFRIRRGDSDCCAVMDCYCDRAQTLDLETKELVIDQGTCCECCCNSCGGVPCHCVCVPCWQCCVGCLVFI
eukprot:425204_1